MSSLREPRFETRRRVELRAELLARAKAWLPEWRPLDNTADFAGALLEITARLESEVAQRLDKAPEKMYRDFLTWLGVRGQASQAARLPLVFSLTANSERVLAAAPIQVQASPPPSSTNGSAEPITFETEEDMMIVPGTVASLYAVDPGADAFYQAPDGFSSLDPPKPGPSSWTVKTLAKAGSTQVQLDPALGLDALPTLLHKPTNLLYRVTQAAAGLVTVEPPIGTAEAVSGTPASAPQDLAAQDTLWLQTAFDPFGKATRNRQEHALYIGSESLLNLPTEATIRISGLPGGITWSYWGKTGADSPIGWQPLKPDDKEPLVTLQKTTGSVEILKIGQVSSRWLKGTVPAGTPAAAEVSHIQLAVNSKGCGTTPQCPPDPTKRSKIAVEGIANTTPLVLDTPFYPLGREPRLFDAFYLGCPEALSKANASVKICLEAQDGTAPSFTAAQVSSTNTMLFGVGNDGLLHRMQQGSDPLVTRLPAVQPPVNELGSATLNATPASLIKTQGRLSTYTRASDLLVAVVAENGVWIWSENAIPKQTGKWYFLGRPTGGLTPELPSTNRFDPSVLLLPDGASIHVVAAIGGLLYEAALAPGWEAAGPAQWKQVPGTDPFWWAGIAPIFDRTSPLTGTPFANGWIGVTENGDASLFEKNATQSSLVKTVATIAPGVRPLAVSPAITGGTPSFLFVSATTANRLDAWQVFYGNTAKKALAHVAAGILGNSFDFSDGGPNGIAVVFANKLVTAGGNIAVWTPQATSGADSTAVYVSQTLPGLVGSPAVAGKSVVAPGASASIIAMPFDNSGLKEIDIPDSSLATALVMENGSDHAKKDDIVVSKFHSGHRKAVRLNDDANSNGSGGFWIKAPGSEKGRVIDDVTVYREESVTPFNGLVDKSKPTIITMEAADPNTHQMGDPVLVSFNNRITFHSIDDIQTVGPDKLMTVKPRIPGLGAGTSTVKYSYLVVRGNLGTTSLLPLIDQVLDAGQADELSKGGAYFRGGDPSPNPLSFKAPGAGPKFSVVLQRAWVHVPVPVAADLILITNTVFGAATVLADNNTISPSLSWEYFDGQAWRSIAGLLDNTSSLRSTGVVQFCVPPGLQPTEVAGRKSSWIRARLVGGDYGSATVTVHTVPDAAGGGSTQTVDRSLSSVFPPVLVSVNLSYSVCCGSDPDYIITSDGGEMRDQTAANTADSAKVEIFTPLADFIQRASSSTTTDTGAKDRAIYVGLDAEISGGPIHLLFFAEEDQDFGDDVYPLRVDVLRETGFEQVVPADGTRGLGETGIVSFSLSSAPPAVSLFGAENRRWLRLRPSARFSNSAGWTPNIRAVYLNAVFARASETQSLERLGSSDGSPAQVVDLARPPVLQGTLELRVREPLGEEEVQALRDADPNSILDELPNGQPGPWVLWKEVDVLEEAGKGARCYSLNSDTGEIGFGDGNHGAIPPIGTDSIVAITYKRGGGAAANNITAWSQLNLVSPVQGIDRVVAPDDAAGGSDPQTPNEVVRFAPANQFIRDRALTLRDFETLAVESSRDIVQARALHSNGGIRLVAVTRAESRRPTQAQWRALLSYLAQRTSPSLAAPGAIAKLPPRLVTIGIELTLTVSSIELSGGVARDATDNIVSLFDPATGGHDQQGWPLGLLPTEADISAALAEVANLQAIERIAITTTYQGAAVSTAHPEDLPVASAEDIRIQFALADVEVGA